MQLIDTDLPEVKVIIPDVFEDNRGFFTESYTQNKFHKLGVEVDFVQDNHSFSQYKGTIRGLHFQSDPMEQSKLVRVIKGSILDVIVDIRADSQNFRKYITVELTDKNFKQVFIPQGFAHGFCTLEDNCHVTYKVDNFYSAENNCGIIWNDPQLNIKWPTENPILSEQDQKWGKLITKEKL